MSSIGFVYIWFDTIKKMFYIGSHNGLKNDGYICTSKRMLRAYRKRPYSFKRRILEYNLSKDKKNTLILEQKWLNMIKSEELCYGKRPRYYNIKRFAAGGDTLVDLDPKTRINIIKKRYGKKHSNAIKAAIKRRTPEQKALHIQRRIVSLQKTYSKPGYINYQCRPYRFYVNGVEKGIYTRKLDLNEKYLLETGCVYTLFKKGVFTFKENRKNRRNPFTAGDTLSVSYII